RLRRGVRAIRRLERRSRGQSGSRVKCPTSKVFPNTRVTSRRTAISGRVTPLGGDGRFQGNGRIGQAADVHGITGGDEATALQEVAGAVHGEQGDQAAGRQPARRPGRGGGITAPQEVLGVAVV